MKCAVAVQKVWTQAKPTADFAWKKYLGFHNVIVVSASEDAATGYKHEDATQSCTAFAKPCDWQYTTHS